MTNEFFIHMVAVAGVTFVVVFVQRGLLYEPLKDQELTRRGIGIVSACTILLLTALSGSLDGLSATGVALVNFGIFITAGLAKLSGDFIFGDKQKVEQDNGNTLPPPTDAMDEAMNVVEREWKRIVR